MFKLVVLFALVAVAVAKPSVGLTHLAYSAPVLQETVYAAPAATSHTYREDTISKPAKILTSYESAPIVQEAIAVEAAPIVRSVNVVSAPAPVIAKTVVTPGSSASTYREDTITKLHPTVEIAAPAVKSFPVVQESVAVEAAPILAKTVAVPAATSSTYREDIISKPAVVSTYAAAAPIVKSVAYSAPAVAYSAPAVAYSAPALAYSAPAVAYSAPAVAYSAPGLAYSAPAYAAPAVLAYSAHVASPSLVSGHVAYASGVPALQAW